MITDQTAKSKVLLIIANTRTDRLYSTRRRIEKGAGTVWAKLTGNYTSAPLHVMKVEAVDGWTGYYIGNVLQHEERT